MATYCTAAELRTQVEKTGIAGADSDAALAIIIEAASRTIDRHCNRPDGFVALSVAAARVYAGQGKPYLLIDECTEITLVAVKDSSTDTTYTSWAATDWLKARGDPEDPDFNHTPYDLLLVLPTGNYSVFMNGQFTGKRGFPPETETPFMIPTVQVTAKWGYATTVPGQIKQATIALAARWWKQGKGAWADTLASPELGQLIYRKENVDIRMMLVESRFVKPAIGRR